MIELQKEKLKINKLIAEKKEIIFVEGDVIVPDSKPDVLNTICTSGIISIYKKEVQDGKVKIDGCINSCIMYMPEDGDSNIRGISTIIDFSENIKITDVKEDMNVVVEAKVKSIETKMINGRKIGVKASIELKIKVYEEENTEIISDIKEKNDIQILKEHLNVDFLVGKGDTKILVKENIQINNEDNLAEILKIDADINDRDIKVSYNKVLTKAELNLEIMYLTEDNRINSTTYKIPLVGFIDMPDVSDESICDVNYCMKNIIVKPNTQEEHSIYIEIETEVMCYVYTEKTINLIQDMYSPIEKISFNQSTINAIANKENRSEIKSIKEKIELKGTENKKLIDVEISTEILSENKINSKILYELEANIKFLFEDYNGHIDIRNIKIPFEYVLDNLKDGEHIEVENIINTKHNDFILNDNGKIDCNIEFQVDSNMYRNVNINTIEGIQEENAEKQDYSVVIYIVKKGDTLWEIAKKFRSTIDSIARVNGIENKNVIMPGEKLYIPKYERLFEEKYG